MFAITASQYSSDDPLSGLELGDRPEPDVPEGWEVVEVKAASLNHHDVWSLRGVGVRRDPPIILGCDAAGVTEDGREVVVHAIVGGGTGVDETLSSDFSILSETYEGTFAEQVAVPSRNLIDKPAGMSFAAAACLPTAYLTAYRALFTRGDLKPGDRLLIQGAGGGVSTAAIQLATAAGAKVYVTSRSEEKRKQALDLGAHEAVESGARLPQRVDLVLESVGEATWDHSMKSLETGGTIVCVGSTTGPNPGAQLNRLFYKQLSVVGSTMGTREELVSLIRFLDATGTEPLIDDTIPMEDGRRAFERMVEGELFGKLVLTRD